MSINIFTIIIQILNFLVLIYVLNKMIYKPLIKLMKDRKEYITNNINDAEGKLKDAESLKQEYSNKLDEIEKYRIEKIKEIDLENIKYKEKQFTLIKEEIDREKTKFLNHLENEKSLILENIVKNIFLNVNSFLKEIFVYLTDKTFNEVVLAKFLKEIRDLPEKEIDRINKVIKDNVDFVSSFDITEVQKEEVKAVFKEKNISFKDINFVKDETIILGNKIVANGLIINSNVSNIIDQFNSKLEQTI